MFSKNSRKKGQMFIVTIVFLVGLVFVVQQILLQYSYLDMQSSYKESDYYLLRSAEKVAVQAVVMAGSCAEAEKNLEESMLFLGEQSIGGYSLDVDYSVNCSNWENEYPDPGPVITRIKVTGENTDTINELVLYSKGAFPCVCAEWADEGCGPTGGCADGEMYSTRSCTPSGCGAESGCLTDATCGFCGDGNIDAGDGEICECGADGTCGNVDDDTNGNDCTTMGMGFTGGTLACSATCDGWDTSSCTGAPSGIEVSSCEELQKIGNDVGYPLDGDYYLTGPIDCSATNPGDPGNAGSVWDNGGLGFDPIGDSFANKFTGTLDGQGFEITDLYIDRQTEDYVGLFGYIWAGSEIENIGVTNGYTGGSRYVGGLVGNNYGSIYNAFFEGEVVGGAFVGGLVGGNPLGIVSSSHSSGIVTGNTKVGGLVGLSNTDVENSYSNADVYGNIDVGGLIGQLQGSLNNSYSTGSVNGIDMVGGLVGENFGKINSSSSAGNTDGDFNVGGLVGSNSGDIDNSYSNVSITGDDDVGGLVGENSGGSLNNSYSAGSVTGNTNVGGLVGSNYGTCKDSFWDTENSGQATSNCGAGETGLPTAQMITRTTFDSLWDFASVWQIEDGTSYPCLQWQGGVGECPVPVVAPTPGTEVSSCEELQKIGNDVGYPLDGDYYLTGPIDCSATNPGDPGNAGSVWDNGGLGFDPIGDSFANKFTGTLDGQGFEITDLYINRPATDYVGLFGVVEYTEIKNIGVTNVDIKSDESGGSLVGKIYANSNIYNSYSSGILTGNGNNGGLAGINYGNITNCHSAVDVTGYVRVAGLVGSHSVGGLITNSYATGDVIGTQPQVGGLAGSVYQANITNSYATGDVTGTDWAGGLAGSVYQANITNSYATGTVSGNDGVGGLAGRVEPGVSIINSYASGNVIGTSNVGGMVGDKTGGTCKDSFWDTENSGQATSNCGAGETGLPTAQMILQTNFDPLWDFASVWQIEDGTSYPCLQWQGIGNCPTP